MESSKDIVKHGTLLSVKTVSSTSRERAAESVSIVIDLHAGIAASRSCKYRPPRNYLGPTARESTCRHERRWTALTWANYPNPESSSARWPPWSGTSVVGDPGRERQAAQPWF